MKRHASRAPAVATRSSRVSSSTNTAEWTISTVVAELAVVVADRLHAVRTRREDLLRAGRLQILDVRGRQLLKHVFVAGPLRRIAGAALLRQHAERDAASRAGSRTAIAATSGSRPRTRRRSRARRARRACAGSNVSSAADVDELLPLVVAEPPDVAAPLEVVVHGAEILGRVAVRHQAAPRSDQDRQVLDADRALVLAGAAGRALPQHLLGSRSRRASCSRSPASSASCVCRMIVFGLSSLPAPHAGQFTWQRPHSTHVNASSTILLPRSLTVSSPTSSFSKSRFGSVAELRRLQEHGDRRQHQMEMLRRGNQREERQDHQHVHPPVHASGQRRLRRAGSVSRNVTISVAMNSAMTIDSADTFVPRPTGRTNARRISR